MTGRRWTERDEQYLADALTRRPITAIARRLGRTEKAVQQYCQRRGWYPTRMDLVTSGEAARLTGLSPQWLTTMARSGAVAAVRVPGGRWWMFDPEKLPDPVIEAPPALNAYITPHAIQRFRERIWGAATDAQAAIVIRMAIASEQRRVRAKQRRDGVPAWTVRTRGIEAFGREFEVRLTLVPGERPGAPPVVVTVLQGTRGWSRGQNWNSELRAKGVPSLPPSRREFKW